MARVYISFLGTNDYLKCSYVYNDDNESNIDIDVDSGNSPVRFVQETTLKLFAEGGKDEARGFIFTTSEAKEKNWVDNGQWDRDKNCKKKCKGLKTCIDHLNLPFSVERVPIPEGNSETELWEIFEKVYNVLDDGDEVVFDVTHAFRSIPMLAIVILNYAKVLKNIRLLGIYYGAFEKLGHIWEVKKMSVERRLAPLLDLSSLDHLMQWAFAVDRFLGAGDAKAVSKLARDNVIPILKASKGKDKGAAAVKDLASALEFFTDRLSTCRGPEIVKAGKFLKNELKKTEHIDFVKPLHPLFKHIQNQVDQFKGKEVYDGIQAAKWCLHHNLIQQGFTILEETIASAFIKMASQDTNDQSIREIASAAANFAQTNKPVSEWYGAAGKHVEETMRFISLHQKEKALSKLFLKISQFRNDINHAGYRPDMKSPEKLKTVLEESLKKAACLLK